MNTPSHAVQDLARTLRSARIARGLSQRELAERAGLGQNRLALIEAGRVDLRTSTLVQLARALDLELVLTPRRMLPAVQSLTQAQPGRPESNSNSIRGTPMRVLRHMQRDIAALERTHPSGKELAPAKSAVQALIDVGPELGISTLQPLRSIAQGFALARRKKAQALPLVAKAAAQLQELRQVLPVTAHPGQEPQVQRAAYSLEDEVS